MCCYLNVVVWFMVLNCAKTLADDGVIADFLCNAIMERNFFKKKRKSLLLAVGLYRRSKKETQKASHTSELSGVLIRP